MKQISLLEGYEDIKDIYYVDSEGVFYSYANHANGRSEKPRILKQYEKTGGYLNVALVDNNKKVRYFRSHRVVASAYCENKDNKPIVNHIDENRQNNNYINLEWVTHKENNLHSLAKVVYQYDKLGNLIEEYTHSRESVANGFNQGHVCACCRNEERQHKGFVFSYEPLSKENVVQRLSKPFYLKGRKRE